MCIAKIIHGNEISFSIIEDCEIEIRYTNEKLIIDRISDNYLNLLQTIITFIKNIIQRYFFSYVLNIIYLSNENELLIIQYLNYEPDKMVFK